MQTLCLPTRDDWRKWLEINHKTVKEIWLVYYKDHTNKPSIPYDDSVEEALCFGWIDSIIKKIDDDCYARKFTPRTDMSNWSPSNKIRVKKMLDTGKMTEAGFATIAGLKLDARAIKKTPTKHKEIGLPDYLKKALMADKKAWENFGNLANSYKRNYILWIDNAKREETRAARIKESIELLRQNKKLGLK